MRSTRSSNVDGQVPDDSDPPRPSTVRERYPRPLERIVMNGLRWDRDRRYPTAEALRFDLEEVARELRLPLSGTCTGRFVRSQLRHAGQSSADRYTTVSDFWLAAPPRTTVGASAARTAAVPVANAAAPRAVAITLRRAIA